MTRYLLLLLVGLGLLSTPSMMPSAWSQDEDDDEAEIEIEEEPDDEEETRKKNVGLGGAGKNPLDDENAPKVKLSLQEQINKAIKQGVKWLKSAQNKDGSWDPCFATHSYETGKDVGKRYRDEMGPTIWAIYTLSKCGVKRKDPVIKKGLKYVYSQTEHLWDETATGKGQIGGRSELQRPSRTTPRTMSTYEVAALIMMIESVYESSA